MITSIEEIDLNDPAWQFDRFLTSFGDWAEEAFGEIGSLSPPDYIIFE